MTLPRHSPHIDTTKRNTLTNRTWESLGFGTVFASTLAVLWGASSFRLYDSTEQIALVRSILLAGYALMCLVAYAMRNRIDPLLQSKAVIASTGLTGFLGTAGVVFAHQANALTGICAILLGFTSTIQTIAGNRIWARIQPEKSRIHLGLSSLLAGAVFFILFLLPTYLANSLTCLLPVAGTWILLHTVDRKTRADNLRQAGQNEKSTVFRLSIWTASFSLMLGVALGALNTLAEKDTFFSATALAMLGVALAGIASFCFALKLSSVRMLTSLDKVSFPAILIGGIIMLSFPGWLSIGGYIFVVFGAVAADLFMWLINAEIVYRTGKTSIEVLARSSFIEWFFTLAGFILACTIGRTTLATFLPNSLAVLQVGCLTILVIVRSFFYTQVDALRIVEAHEGAKNVQRIQRACEIISNECGLSQRESEVLPYLAEGRSVPFIEEELTLSQSTVKTHVRNIYRKLGVASKQELIDVVKRTDKNLV